MLASLIVESEDFSPGGVAVPWAVGCLGMEVLQTRGKYCYQFPVELDSRMADAELSAVLQRTKEKIEERYPDDFVGRAVGYITVVIDGKKIMKHLG